MMPLAALARPPPRFRWCRAKAVVLPPLLLLLLAAPASAPARSPAAVVHGCRCDMRSPRFPPSVQPRCISAATWLADRVSPIPPSRLAPLRCRRAVVTWWTRFHLSSMALPSLRTSWTVRRTEGGHRFHLPSLYGAPGAGHPRPSPRRRCTNCVAPSRCSPRWVSGRRPHGAPGAGRDCPPPLCRFACLHGSAYMRRQDFPPAPLRLGAPPGVPPDSFYFALHLIPVKLKADNYPLGAAAATSSRYLEGYVDGTYPCPSPYDPAYHAWVAQDQAILSAIQSSLTPSVSSLVIFAATSRDAWTALHTSFASQSQARAHAIRTELGEAKLQDLSITDYFNKGKYDEHNSKFSLRKEPRFIEPEEPRSTLKVDGGEM
ncbi:hypothetical protein QYE76_015830 [Lolium multiflorum]|uniref:Uncharacterized protein n=1 Tax=Lolium multiflorum TaxID=4521 RepID=A0AAD8U7Q5_LOLMU|nr:hypothetical protein QYE76_015830 [Lolium multiflorum]